jgi:hypothetical protein
LMHNTNNHASLGAKGEKHWWLSVHHRRSRRRVTFSFVDFGVGIFRSLDGKRTNERFHGWRTSEFGTIIPPGATNAQLLQLILTGEMHRTVTKEDFRGKGLPGIREVWERNHISNLRIVTNDVYADVARDEYRTLNPPFDGTLVVWELEESNRSCPYDDDDDD